MLAPEPEVVMSKQGLLGWCMSLPLRSRKSRPNSQERGSWVRKFKSNDKKCQEKKELSPSGQPHVQLKLGVQILRNGRHITCTQLTTSAVVTKCPSPGIIVFPLHVLFLEYLERYLEAKSYMCMNSLIKKIFQEHSLCARQHIRCWIMEGGRLPSGTHIGSHSISIKPLSILLPYFPNNIQLFKCFLYAFCVPTYFPFTIPNKTDTIIITILILPMRNCDSEVLSNFLKVRISS